MGKEEMCHIKLIGKPEQKKKIRIPSPRCEDNIKADLEKQGVRMGLDSHDSG
jgi:hypothetical protein